jgi:hypothetical protein
MPRAAPVTIATWPSTLVFIMRLPLPDRWHSLVLDPFQDVLADRD